MRKLLFICTMFCVLGMQAQTSANRNKLSNHLCKLLDKQAQATRKLLALMKTEKGENIHKLASEHGFQVVDSVGAVYIVRIGLNKLANLSNDPRVYRVEAERMPRQAMDVTPAQINATDVYAGIELPQAFTGKGVAAGIFDSGFDFTHPAFLDGEGKLRVRYYYDFKWPNDDGTFGHELNTTEEIAEYEHTRNGIINIHGTHVAGIMAGSAVNGKYQGMAPESDIYIADFNSYREDFSNPDEETSAVAVLGFKYIFEAAEAAGQPCVVNFSNCESITLTRQRTLETEALLSLVGPGRIIVSAAGNDGFRSSYLEKEDGVKHGGTAIINGVGSGEIIDIDFVAPKPQTVTMNFLGIRLVGGSIEGTITFNTDSIDSLDGDTCVLTANVSMGEVTIKVWKSNFTDPRGCVYHIDGHMPNPGYLVICGATILFSGDGPVWAYTDVFFSPFSNITSIPEYSKAKEGYTVSWPATLDGIISVGATGYKPTVKNIDGETYTGMESFAPDKNGYITKFSSRGPTFDGRFKPVVVAPGMNINAAYNSFVEITDNMRKELTDKITYNGKEYYITAQSGTSMASPVVAGSIALWLQARPDLTPDQIIDVLEHTCSQPDPQMEYPNNTYGYGQIDVYRGLLYVLGLETSVGNLSTNQPEQAHFRLDGRQLHISYDVDIVTECDILIYNIKGMIVGRYSNTDTIDLSTLPKGIYAVQLSTRLKSTTGSTLIRL